MIYRLGDLESRAASAENPTAARGAGGQAGGGLKGAPAIKDLAPGAEATLLDIEGPGMLRHLWITPHDREPDALRSLVLRMYWEGSAAPSVEVPLGDFFGVAHGARVNFASEWIVVQPDTGLNAYFPMPFARHARVTIANGLERPVDWLFYQIDFTLGDAVDDGCGRFHAAFRRENPCPLGHDFTILDTAGRGVYAGCTIGVRALSGTWWGEGQVKIYLDGDTSFPTICGTGLEDYIGGAWGLEEHAARYQGAPLYRGRHASLYRLHAPDPIYFRQRIRVTAQQMGAGLRRDLEPVYGDRLVFSPKNHPRRKPDDGYYLRSDDWCATAYWYQFPPVGVPPLPPRAARCADLYVDDGESKTKANL